MTRDLRSLRKFVHDHPGGVTSKEAAAFFNVQPATVVGYLKKLHSTGVLRIGSGIHACWTTRENTFQTLSRLDKKRVSRAEWPERMVRWVPATEVPRVEPQGPASVFDLARWLKTLRGF